VGFFRPCILVPTHSAAWSPAQLAAVLTHQGSQARRRYPLMQWLALLNRAPFCFHRLACWLERRLAFVAENACDATLVQSPRVAVQIHRLFSAVAMSDRCASGFASACRRRMATASTYGGLPQIVQARGASEKFLHRVADQGR
jgi:hypothetical protein